MLYAGFENLPVEIISMISEHIVVSDCHQFSEFRVSREEPIPEPTVNLEFLCTSCRVYYISRRNIISRSEFYIDSNNRGRDLRELLDQMSTHLGHTISPQFPRAVLYFARWFLLSEWYDILLHMRWWGLPRFTIRHLEARFPPDLPINARGLRLTGIQRSNGPITAAPLVGHKTLLSVSQKIKSYKSRGLDRLALFLQNYTYCPSSCGVSWISIPYIKNVLKGIAAVDMSDYSTIVGDIVSSVLCRAQTISSFNLNQISGYSALPPCVTYITSYEYVPSY